MKKILIEIVSMTIAYLVLSIYAYYNSDLKENSWWVSALLLIGFYVLFSVINKNKYK